MNLHDSDSSEIYIRFIHESQPVSESKVPARVSYDAWSAVSSTSLFDQQETFIFRRKHLRVERRASVALLGKIQHDLREIRNSGSKIRQFREQQIDWRADLETP
mgnify:CR=1 FL=1